MKKIMVILMFTLNINTALASRTNPSTELYLDNEKQSRMRAIYSEVLFYDKNKPVKLPKLTYQMLKSKG